MRGMDNLGIKLPARLCIRLEVELVAMLATAADHSARNHLRHLADGLRIITERLENSYVTTIFSNETDIYLLGVQKRLYSSLSSCRKTFLAHIY